MRLIKAPTLEFEEFFDSDTPRYAILSHTWGHEEVSLADARRIFAQVTALAAGFTSQSILSSLPHGSQNAGLDKIIRTCAQALKDDLQYVWIDTCCIDKTSSAELSEAINSMFRWYESAEVCYTYLADVPSQPNWDTSKPGHSFSSSRWFTRGWTLQELLAPSIVVFFASDWSIIATRGELSGSISSITGIDAAFLFDASVHPSPYFAWQQQHKHGNLRVPVSRLPDDIKPKAGRSSKIFSTSLAERMSWASNRKTTRVEDTAYCLLGILGVNMPLIYGEGSRAFIRIQEELLKISDDMTILAWGLFLERKRLEWREIQHPWKVYSDPLAQHSHPFRSRCHLSGLLAKNPACFRGCGNIMRMDFDTFDVSFTLNNRRLSTSLPLSDDDHPYLILPCRLKSHPFNLLAIELIREGGNTFARRSEEKSPKGPILVSGMILVDINAWDRWATTPINLRITISDHEKQNRIPDSSFYLRNLPKDFSLTNVQPSETYTPSKHIVIPNLPLSEVGRFKSTQVVFRLRHEPTGVEILVRIQATQLASIFERSVISITQSITLNTAKSQEKHVGSGLPRYLVFNGGLLYPTHSSAYFGGKQLVVIDMNHTDTYYRWLTPTWLGLKLKIQENLTNKYQVFMVTIDRNFLNSLGNSLLLLLFGTRLILFVFSFSASFSCTLDAVSAYGAVLHDSLPWISIRVPKAARFIRTWGSLVPFAIGSVYLLVPIFSNVPLVMSFALVVKLGFGPAYFHYERWHVNQYAKRREEVLHRY
ncbi:heterokaryon incompatibility protein-domain-containing protein [Cladorrhinum sp. PSN259]|nr:heterokaryon incompatibility protein-domain-containing protein [Cladorrhinum sp. PSN259]